MNQLHKKLSQRSCHYAKWHAHPYHHHLHWLGVVLVFFISASVIIGVWGGVAEEQDTFISEIAGIVVAQAQTGCTSLNTANSISDLRNKLSQANPGDTVCLAAGDYDLSGTLDIPGGITLQGAGSNQTIIRRTGSDADDWMARMDCSNDGPSRVTGLAFEGNSTNSKPWGAAYSGLTVSGNCTGFRLDHVRFERMGKYGVQALGDVHGVIDQNEFINNFTYNILADGGCLQTATGPQPPSCPWTQPLQLGTDKALYVEGNYFEGNDWAFMDGLMGGRYVFRYNTLKVPKCAVGDPNDEPFDNCRSGKIIVHGSRGTTYNQRSGRSWEVYGNTLEVPTRGTQYGQWMGINMTGGDGVIFNNDLTGIFQEKNIIVTDENKAGSKANCTYPCLDQIREAYVWGNTWNTTLQSDGEGRPPQSGATWWPYVRSGADVVQKNRDYFLAEPNIVHDPNQSPNPTGSYNYQVTTYQPYICPHPLVTDYDAVNNDYCQGQISTSPPPPPNPQAPNPPNLSHCGQSRASCP